MIPSSGHIIFIHSGEVLVRTDTDGSVRLPLIEEFLLPNVEKSAFSFDRPLHAKVVRVEDVETLPLSGTDSWVALRKSASLLPQLHYTAASKASELLYWDSESRFCGRCGAPMERSSEISKRCSVCGHEIWPSVAPAIIVLVRRGEKALLVHARTFSRPFFGLVAGFVETGENLEECVRREVREETSLEIKNIRYFDSQQWPYPSQLMLGFTAEYESGELHFADGELTAGGFFSRDNLPLLPEPPSIARRLIEDWLKN